jgi:hypothetical protein
MALFTVIWIVAVALATVPSAEELNSCEAAAWLARMALSSRSVSNTASGTEISYTWHDKHEGQPTQTASF